MKAYLTLLPEQNEQLSKEATERKENWLAAVDRLFQEVEEWVRSEPSWNAKQENTDIDEEALGGKYNIKVLSIQTPKDRVILEPIACAVLGANGRVDFYGWPSLHRVMLLRDKQTNEWIIRTDSGINWPQPWNRETFFDLAKRLLRDE